MEVTGINADDTIIGMVYFNGTQTIDVFSYANGSFTVYGAADGEAYSINNAGVIVGNAQKTIGFSGVEFSNGNIIDLGFNGSFSASAINNNGLIVGTVSGADGRIHAATALNGVLTTLPDPPLYADPNGTAVNDSGDVYGLASGPNAEHGWVFAQAQSLLLDSLTDTGGNPLSGPTEVNNQGQILVEGSSPIAAYVLTPVQVHLGLTVPTMATPGQPITVTVTALDPSGHVVATDDGDLVVTTTDGSAMVPAGVELAHGVATFNVTLVTGGNQTVTATDSRFPAVTGVSATIPTFVPPIISAQPVGSSVATGGSLTLSIAASAQPSPTYQWLLNGEPISGATQASYTLSDSAPDQSGSYSVQVGNGYGSILSNPVFVVVTAAGGPTLGLQPHSYSIYPSATFVLVAGESPAAPGAAAPAVHPNATAGLTYQWYWNGVAVTDGDGAIGSQTGTLLLSGAASQPGSYQCLVANSAGAILSEAGVITVAEAAVPGHLINVSCRADAGSGTSTLITGFVLGGSGTSGPENVLVRASGPALVPFGVTGVLPDPLLQVYQTSAPAGLIAINFGWAGASAVSTAASAVGAFGWPDATSKDSAVLETLAMGAYTANISGSAGDSGVALAEVYDAGRPPTNTGMPPRLINVSARIVTGIGSGQLIAGFVIGGGTAKTVLIRASGPALQPFGVSGTLPDPSLQLYSGSNVIAANTGWGGSTQIATTAAAVGAFSWGSSATPDSAIVVTLPPGAYTAEVAGQSGDTGDALVEIYDVP